MRQIETELERVLTLLRNKIRQRGYTQLEVQEVLSAVEAARREAEGFPFTADHTP